MVPPLCFCLNTQHLKYVMLIRRVTDDLCAFIYPNYQSKWTSGLALYRTKCNRAAQHLEDALQVTSQPIQWIYLSFPIGLNINSHNIKVKLCSHLPPASQCSGATCAPPPGFTQNRWSETSRGQINIFDAASRVTNQKPLVDCDNKLQFSSYAQCGESDSPCSQPCGDIGDRQPAQRMKQMKSFRWDANNPPSSRQSSDHLVD